MEPVDYLSIADDIIEKIKAGAFLTVRAGDRLNTMTIGWAAIGLCWRKPVFMVAVRDSRHTFDLIERAADYTVSVPDGDKLAACNLKTLDGQQVASPVIDTPGIHFECRIIYKSAMDPSHLASDLKSLYPEKDYHTLYFGDIVACYRI